MEADARLLAALQVLVGLPVQAPMNTKVQKQEVPMTTKVQKQEAFLLGPWPPPACRHGATCWRPCCPFGHGSHGRRAAVVSELAKFWQEQAAVLDGPGQAITHASPEMPARVTKGKGKCKSEGKEVRRQWAEADG